MGHLNGQTGEIDVIFQRVQYSNIAYRILRTSLTLNDTGIFPKGVTCVMEGDVSNGTKRRIYFIMEDWKVYNYQPGRDVQYLQHRDGALEKIFEVKFYFFSYI